MTGAVSSQSLNGVCPYFTMFPLEFPMSVLAERAKPGEWVLDPFCGRGTTVFAARLLGLRSVGVDSSPVAAAIARAKIANTTPDEIAAAAKQILTEVTEAKEPEGEFWTLAFEPSVLALICRLRDGLLRDCVSDARAALQAILLGALHGPQAKLKDSYFSNQCQRTYAPKPAYAVGFWNSRGLSPRKVDVLHIIEERAQRYYGAPLPPGTGCILAGDSRDATVLSDGSCHAGFRWVITSPPYYGMRTYLPDQWLRLWFLGGPAGVQYSNSGQLGHSSPGEFADQLRAVWKNVRQVSAEGAMMVIRFGGIHDRKADPLSVISQSLGGSGWSIESISSAGSASSGRRQALHFAHSSAKPMEEYDIWLTRTGSM